jgi:acetylornithine deacetylase/succinyl-diaminopimelate desuccinylase-like protein
MTEPQDVLATIDRERGRYLEELKELLRIPSISADPRHQGDVRRAADMLRGRLESAGLSAELIERGDGNPLVYGEWLGAPGKPTILFYGHYDVQPPDPIEEWRHPPFEPTEEDGRLVARGATDDKGQSYAHVKAVEAVMATRGELPVNVKFLIEGEEEVGGETIEAYVREDAGRLACDAVVVSDSSMYAPGQPSLVYGLRGLCYMEIRVQGPNRDLHSGSYGGGVRNPANALAAILAGLRDEETGRVLVPGFYDDVRPLEDWERQELAALPFDEAEYTAEIGVPAVAGEEGYTTKERTCARPTLDVNGIWGGYQGEGAKTILPARAGAKVSMRLVPDQRPHEIARLFREHVERLAPSGVTVEVRDLHHGEGALIDVEGPLVEAAMDALEAEWGKRPVRVREGGSIPIVATFAEVLAVPVVLIGFGLDDDRLHAPNEKFDIAHFYGGIRTVARFLDRAAAAGGDGA